MCILWSGHEGQRLSSKADKATKRRMPGVDAHCVGTMRCNSPMARTTGVGEAGQQACTGPKDGSIPFSLTLFSPFKNKYWRKAGFSWPSVLCARQRAEASAPDVEHDFVRATSQPVLARNALCATGSERVPSRLSRTFHLTRAAPQPLPVAMLLHLPRWLCPISSPGSGHAASICSRSKLANGPTWTGARPVGHIRQQTMRMRPTRS